jgi:outer membrane protein assembly factor BamE (lipoprotein component of BamABCDE complex)
MNMKNLLLPLLVVASVLAASGCATNKFREISKITVGMDKAEVLETLGNPTRKSRVYGQDRWAYEFAKSDNSGVSTTYIFFAEGRVSHVDARDY